MPGSLFVFQFDVDYCAKIVRLVMVGKIHCVPRIVA